jgi:hypothetical protein
MYKCLEAGKYLYGVMTWDVLKSLFALRYPSAEMAEIREIFDTTPSFYQWFTERSGKLVLNGYEKDDYYIYLETEVQGDVPFYIPAKEEIEELYERGCLISRENHAKLQDFISETFGCDKDTASLKVHELYEGVNNRVRMNDAVEAFTEGFADGLRLLPGDAAGGIGDIPKSLVANHLDTVDIQFFQPSENVLRSFYTQIVRPDTQLHRSVPLSYIMTVF